MRHVSKVALLVAAALALSGLAASGASAAGQWEWLEESHGVFNQIGSPLTVKPTTTITVNDTTGSLEITCEVELEGALESGGVAKLSSWHAKSCKGARACLAPTSTAAENLPWKTELYKSGVNVRERIVSGGSGTPSLSFLCETSVGPREDRCNLNTNAQVFNAGLGAEARFDAESSKTSCTAGGAGSGEVTGFISYPHPSGTEAIKVQEVEAKVGTWKQAGIPITSSVPIKWAGKVALADKGTGVTIECEATGEGVAEPSHVGKYTKATLTGCKVIKSAGLCLSAEAEAVHLPWHVELSDTLGKRALITSGGSGEPGFNRICETIIGKASNVITGKKLQMSLENVAGGVNSTFIWPGEWLKCTAGHEGSIEGTQLIEAIGGGKLEVE